MQTFSYLIKAELQATPNSFDTELEPFRQHFPQVQHPRPTIKANDIHIHTVSAFQIGGGKQMGHQPFHINPIRTRHDHKTGRIFMIRFISEIHYHR